MEKTKSLDVRIASFIIRTLKYYIKKRTFQPPPPSETEIWESVFQTNEQITHDLTDSIRIILHKDSILCRLIYKGFEENEINFVKKFLKRGDTFIDIGANIGLYSLIASEMVGDRGMVYSFEPTPEIFSRLSQNVDLNKFTNIRLINTGLSNEDGIAKFNISNDGFDAWNSMIRLDQLKNSREIEIDILKLDTFIKKESVSRVDLVKLDVEGWEKFVLEGADRLLVLDDAPVFLVEYTEANAFKAGYYLGELFDLMIHYNYNWYSYDSGNNSLIQVAKKLHYPYENLIAVKNLPKCISRLNQ